MCYWAVLEESRVLPEGVFNALFGVCITAQGTT